MCNSHVSSYIHYVCNIEETFRTNDTDSKKCFLNIIVLSGSYIADDYIICYQGLLH